MPEAVGIVPPFWEAGHRFHLAAACTDLQRWGEVADHLDAAPQLASQWARLQPLSRTVIAQLVEHRSRRSEQIADLAEHYGLEGG